MTTQRAGWALSVLGLATAGLVAGCSSSPPVHTSGLTLQDLTTADACPVPLAAAADAADATPSAAVESPEPGSALAQAQATSVTCDLTTTVGGTPTDLDLTLAASHQPATAVNLLLPTVLRDGGMTLTELKDVVKAAADTDTGHLVPLPGDDPVALAIIHVDGATSAAFVLSADPRRDGGAKLTRDQLDQIATRLASKLT